MERGKLYIVGTPIGNLKDITLRALETFKEVDVIACEDTRHTLGLLTHYEIKKPLISYYKPKEREGAERVLRNLSEGRSVALVTDAGMPCISDPGSLLVKEAREAGYDVISVPGPTAVATAVALSGIIEPVFVFIGFLPAKKKDKKALLAGYKDIKASLVFYCSPHDIKDDLKCFYETFGARKVSVIRELTKVYESVDEGTLGEFDIEEARGEYVVIVHAPEIAEESKPEGSIEEQVGALIASGVSKKDAIKQVAKQNGLPKDEVYKKFI